MFSIAVKDHIMVAHSLDAEIFGPAQQLHGATYVVTTIYKRPDLDQNNSVIDMGLAHRILKEVLADLNFKNLDNMPIFNGQTTTTEFLCGHIHEMIAQKIKHKFTGVLKVVLEESHVAWASYEKEISA